MYVFYFNKNILSTNRLLLSPSLCNYQPKTCLVYISCKLALLLVNLATLFRFCLMLGVVDATFIVTFRPNVEDAV